MPFGKEEVTARLFIDALSLLGSGREEDILYIAPTPRKAREAMKIFTGLISKKTFIPPHFLTLKQLAQEVYFSFGNRILLPDALKPVFIASLRSQRLRTDERKRSFYLSYYAHIGELIKDLKQALCFENWEETKRLLKENLLHLPEMREELDWVFEIIEEYERNLVRRGLLDSEDLLKEATNAFRRKREKQKGVLIIDGFMDLTKLEESFLSAVILSFDNLLALAYFDTNNEEVYSLPKEFYDFLLQVLPGDLEIITLGEKKRIGTEGRRAHLFPSREEEVEGIAKRIKKSFSEGRLTLSKTIVTFPDLSLYAPIIERVFTKYKIPFTLYPQRTLSASPVIIPVISLLRAVRDDYPRIETTICLSSPFFHRISEKTKHMIAFYARKAGIIKGRESWLSLFRNLGEEKVAKHRRVMRDINRFLSETMRLRKERSSLLYFIRELKLVLEELGWLAEEREPAFLEDKKEFFLLLERMSYLGDVESSLQEFVMFIEGSLQYTLIFPEKEERGVRVLGLMETRGLSCENIFFGGLIESSLPSSLTRDPFLPDWLRKKIGLLDLERHQGWQKLHFFRVCATPRNEPFLSYPRQEGNQLFLPSPFLEGEALPPPSDTIIFTEEERDRQKGKGEPLSFIKPVDFSTDSEIQNKLKRRLPRGLTVTELESARRCPYLFYLKNLLGLEIAEEERFEIEAREWGDLVHQVFERLYAAGELPIEEIPKRVEDILTRSLVEKRFPPFWQDVAKSIFDKLLCDFISEERRLREAGLSPYKTEERVRGKILGIFVSGKIDRIDRGSNGYALLDYKTGGTDITRKDILNGSHLQLPLYSYLWKEKGLAINRLGIYSLRERRVKWLALTPLEVAEAENHAIQFAKDTIDTLLKGRFLPKPVPEKVCRYCEWQFLCPRHYEGDRE